MAFGSLFLYSEIALTKNGMSNIMVVYKNSASRMWRKGDCSEIVQESLIWLKRRKQ